MSSKSFSVTETVAFVAASNLDTHGCMGPDQKYTIPISGFYTVATTKYYHAGEAIENVENLYRTNETEVNARKLKILKGLGT